MPKKATAKTKHRSKSVLLKPVTWVIAALSLALLVVCCILAHEIGQPHSTTELDSAKLSVFDNLIESYIEDFSINITKPSINEVTGYGISDEDGVFYVTLDFSYYDYDEGTQTPPEYEGLQHAILYFWKDEERNTYSHAFSYHDDYYHPGGIYVEVGDHSLRQFFAQ